VCRTVYSSIVIQSRILICDLLACILTYAVLLCKVALCCVHIVLYYKLQNDYTDLIGLYTGLVDNGSFNDHNDDVEYIDEFTLALLNGDPIEV
jgi:hypothetical protein